jgi:hypothetical protein
MQRNVGAPVHILFGLHIFKFCLAPPIYKVGQFLGEAKGERVNITVKAKREGGNERAQGVRGRE